MKCKICNQEIPEGGHFCPKCGNPVPINIINKSELEKGIIQLRERSSTPQLKNYYNRVLKTISTNKFEQVQYTYETSLLDDISKKTKHLIEGNGKLHILVNDEEFLAKLSVAIILNHFESIDSGQNRIFTGQHDDRVSKIKSAYIHFQRNELDEASKIAIRGISELEKELMTGLKDFSNLPKEAWKKLFCGKTVRQIDILLNNMKEGIDTYISGICLLLCVDLERKDTSKVLVTINEGKKFLSNFTKEYGYARLLEYDDDSAQQWREKITSCDEMLSFTSKQLEMNTLILNLEDNENE